MIGLWNNDSAARATGGKAQGLWNASRVEIDSRRIQLGDLFVAIRGERVDGHDYVAEALAKGAVAAVVAEIPAGLGPDAPLLLVADTMEALVGLARAGRARSLARIVGITGSVGKTSTKEMLALALAAHGKTYATTGNFNNHIGTPLNLANLPPDAMFGVFEMGMNHAGEIEYLTKMVRPDVAVITTVEAVHLEFFKDTGEIAQAKAEIFAGVPAHGAAVLPGDNIHVDYLREQAQEAGIANILTFGSRAGNDAALLAYDLTSQGIEIGAFIGGQTISFPLALRGKHWASIALSVLLAAYALGLPLPKTAAALADFSEVAGRGKTLPLAMPTGKAWLIDDAYNASPASMKAAIAKADEVWQANGGKGRKIAALGDMLELGPTGPQLHADLAYALDAHGFDLVFTAGKLMQHLSDALPREKRAGHTASAQELLPLLQQILGADDVLLVKGSHGSKMYQLAEALKQ